jgi:hypothetical protein
MDLEGSLSFTRFQVFTAAKMEFVIYRLLHRAVCWYDTNVSEDRAASIFMTPPQITTNATTMTLFTKARH